MSSEVVKKRGRPKKIISDPVEVPEGTKKSTTRAKSTKAAPKVTKATPPASAKSPVVEKPISKPIASSSTPPKVATKPPAHSAVASQKVTSAPTKPSVKIPVTPESSKILNELRQQSAKTVPTPADSVKSSKPSPTATASKTSSFTSQPKAALSPTRASSNSTKPAIKPIPTPQPAHTAAKPTPPPSAKSVPKPHIPIAALNSEIVSNISTRAGARPNVAPGQQLAKDYKRVARKVTMAIVAMPIVIVTSWVLYERLVLGKDRKLLVIPGLAKVETPVVAEGKAESPPATS